MLARPIIAVSLLFAACDRIENPTVEGEPVIDPDVAYLLSEVGALRRELVQVRGDTQGLHAQLATAQDSMVACQEDLDDVQAELTTQSIALADADGVLDTLRVDVDGLTGAVVGNTAQLEALEPVDTSGFVTVSTLANYATQSFVASLVDGLDLSVYATHADVSASIGSIDHGVFLRADALAPYTTMSDVEAAIAAVDHSPYLQSDALGDYALESYVDSAITAVDLTPYALSTDVTAAIAAVDHSAYLTASSLSGYATEGWVAGQGYSTDIVDDSLNDLLDYLVVDTTAHRVTFEGANVYVQSGSGTTDGVVNGLGNLIVGYDEDTTDIKTGSHNLVVGTGHTYTQFGGIVAGVNSSVTADYGSVLGGHDNAVSGVHSVVLGGQNNAVSGNASVVLGGMNHAVTTDVSVTP